MPQTSVLTMDLQEVLRMAAGGAPTTYAANSNFQGDAMAKARPVVQQSVEELCSAMLPGAQQQLVVADLGSSYGPNAFAAISAIVDAVIESCRKLQHRGPPPEVQFFLNDLPANDFNSVFRSLASYKRQLKEEQGDQELPGRLYVAGVPGSFYGRLFPSRSVHLFHSSSSLHWLSQVPEELQKKKVMNKGNIYVGRRSPSGVHEAYRQQFQRDFSTFLRCRSEEIRDGGLMVLTIIVTTASDHPRSGTTILICELISEVLKSMADEGIIKEADIDAFNVPFYNPSMEEVQAVISDQDAFQIARENVVESYWDGFADRTDAISSHMRGQSAVRTMRAAMEPLFACQLGDGNVVDDMFTRLAGVLTREFEKGEQLKCPFYVVTLRNN